MTVCRKLADQQRLPLERAMWTHTDSSVCSGGWVLSAFLKSKRWFPSVSCWLAVILSNSIPFLPLVLLILFFYKIFSLFYYKSNIHPPLMGILENSEKLQGENKSCHSEKIMANISVTVIFKYCFTFRNYLCLLGFIYFFISLFECYFSKSADTEYHSSPVPDFTDWSPAAPSTCLTPHPVILTLWTIFPCCTPHLGALLQLSVCTG